MNFQDEGLPPEVIERLVRRPEDLPVHVEHNIKIYKSNALRILEVTFQIWFSGRNLVIFCHVLY